MSAGLVPADRSTSDRPGRLRLDLRNSRVRTWNKLISHFGDRLLSKERWGGQYSGHRVTPLGCEEPEVQIRDAIIPEEISLVRGLFREYAEGLGFDLGFQGFAKELAELPGRYARPAGGLWLAVEGENIAGCVALRPLDPGLCEIKRLYVRPAFRGCGFGRTLAEFVLRAAADAGYHRVCLDTMPSMLGAIALYRALGFAEIEAYWDNPMRGAIFLGRTLG